MQRVPQSVGNADCGLRRRVCQILFHIFVILLTSIFSYLSSREVWKNRIQIILSFHIYAPSANASDMKPVGFPGTRNVSPSSLFAAASQTLPFALHPGSLPWCCDGDSMECHEGPRLTFWRALALGSMICLSGPLVLGSIL